MIKHGDVKQHLFSITTPASQMICGILPPLAAQSKTQTESLDVFSRCLMMLGLSYSEIFCVFSLYWSQD